MDWLPPSTTRRRLSSLLLGLLLALPCLVGGGCSKAGECEKAFQRWTTFEKLPFATCKAACDDEASASSCQYTSWCYRDGTCAGYQGPADPVAALRYLRRACELDKKDRAAGKARPGSVVGCSDTTREECLVDATSCEQRCEKNDADACLVLADMHWRKVGPVRADRELAMALYRKACDLRRDCLGPGGGYSVACDLQKPSVCVERCEKGDANACYWTSAMYREGNEEAGVARDTDRSWRYLELACDAAPGISRRCADLR